MQTRSRPPIVGGAVKVVGKSVTLGLNAVGWGLHGACVALDAALNLSKTAHKDIRQGMEQADAVSKVLSLKRQNRRISKAEQVIRDAAENTGA